VISEFELLTYFWWALAMCLLFLCTAIVEYIESLPPPKPELSELDKDFERIWQGAMKECNLPANWGE